MQIVSPFFAPYRQKKEDFFMYEKKVGKRLLTWVLVLVMTLSLLPLNVLAAEVSGEGTDVVYGYDTGSGWLKDENGTGTDLITNVEGVDSVSKTAEPTGNSNEYTVTLQVVLKETTTNGPSQAATVLVIDTSGSMGEGCQKWWHTHNSNCPLPLEGCQGCGHQFP